ncbi:geranylgeranyl pyrophosphate synthase [Aspergillus heteromorphus CBS 117.55]|uniref:Geranylgeranyl pyrophosphate synthase n=1 Tax=Aspergillus heteromorphus CBS 117.55 TaxID=1448321 RepID=A0A317WP29_9EURO|nr:geranylgeranyl pyrophosphate synthase [Aspergillus heteromorphus CBS 117.55]PWY88153.1 geranylgeranyl pyrophosphate synthase [Aspergillus heteromorphus CBS 117.55]
MFKQYSHILSHKRRRSRASTVQVLSTPSEPASDVPPAPEPVEVWTHSQPIADDEPHREGCFTTLSPRIHKYDHVAQRGSDRFVEDLQATLQTSEPPASYLASPVGNYASFLYPECLPERLEVVAYLTELCGLHDGKPPTESADVPVESPRTVARKALLDKALAQLSEKEIDGHEIIDCYRSNWLVTPDVPTAENCANLDDYVARRRLNAGIDVYWTLMGFAHGTRLGKEDQAVVRDALDAAERTMFFTNDYYSWPKEKRLAKKRPIANVILFLMQHQHMSEDDATAKTKQLVLDNEAEFVRRRDALYQATPDLAPQLRKWMEVLGAALAGIHYWCKNAPRYAVPETAEESEVEEVEVEVEGGSSSSAEGDDDDDDEDEEESSDDETSADDAEEESQEDSEAEDREPVAERAEPGEGAVWTPLAGEDESPDSQLDTSALLAPTSYARAIAATALQTDLIAALNVWTQVPSRPLASIKQVITAVQDATHMLEDLQDQASLREGRTPAPLVYGPAQCLNSAAYTFVRVARIVSTLNCPGMLDGLLQDLEAHFVGQSWELNWRFSTHCPAEGEYLAMVDQRSGALFRMLMRLMQAASMGGGSTLDLEPLAKALGRLSQIRHEYLGLLADSSRPFGQDLDHGRVTYPVVRACNLDPASKVVIFGIFRQKTEGAALPVESKRQIVSLVHQTGALQATYDLLRQLGRQVTHALSDLETAAEELNPALRAVVKALADVPAPGP